VDYSEHHILTYILVEADFLIQESHRLDLVTFQQDGALRRAFSRSLDVVARAAARIGDNTRRQYPDVEWQRIDQMANSFGSDCFVIDYEAIWTVVHGHIPTIRLQFGEILAGCERLEPRSM
jgi:uncharacterized protein with HEPN domain